MKTKLVGFVVLSVVVLAAALPAEAHLFHHFAAASACTNCQDGNAVQQIGPAPAAPSAGGWQDGYYDTAWGMPLAVLVPPTARWQTDYSWGVSSVRMSPIDSHFRPAATGPESAYRMNNYLPAPPQPSDTRQMGDYYVRGPRR